MRLLEKIRSAIFNIFNITTTLINIVDFLHRQVHSD